MQISTTIDRRFALVGRLAGTVLLALFSMALGATAFGQPIKISKAVTAEPFEVQPGVWQWEYTLFLKNTGLSSVSNIQVVDDLGAALTGALGYGNYVVTPPAGATTNPNYGTLGDWNLLAAPGLTLAAGVQTSMKLRVDAVPKVGGGTDDPDGYIYTWLNQAQVVVGGVPGDLSGPGVDPDFANDDKTPVTFKASPYELGDQVWNDLDGDGWNEPLDGEFGIPGVDVVLQQYDPINGVWVDNIDAALTDANGNFLFDVINGTYRIKLIGVAEGVNATVQNNLAAGEDNDSDLGTVSGGVALTDQVIIDGASVYNLDAGLTDDPEIGIIKWVSSGPTYDGTTEDPELGTGFYELTYTLVVENTGPVALYDVKVNDDLKAMLGDPGSDPKWAVTGKTALGTSSLVLNPLYNGDAVDVLAASPNPTDPFSIGEKETFTITLRVANPVYGEIYNNQALAAGVSPIGTPAEDLSDDRTGVENPVVGPDPTGEGEDDPTPFEIPEPIIGIAKKVSAGPTYNGADVDLTFGTTGFYEFTYQIYVENMGPVSLFNVEVTDDLTDAFGDPGVNPQWYVIGSGPIGVSTSLVHNPDFVGGPADALLASSPNGTTPLLPGANATFFITVRLKNPVPNETYLNTAVAEGVDELGTPTTDDSQDDPDLNPSPDDNDDPRDNDDPTPITFPKPIIGLAKAVSTPLYSDVDGSYSFTYTVLVKNMGPVKLFDVKVEDDLAAMFAAAPPASWSVTGKDITTWPTTTLTLNGSYDGAADIVLISNGTLEPGQEETITIDVKVKDPDFTHTYLNTASGSGVDANGTPAEDDSQNGVDPDPPIPPAEEGDGDPTNNNEPTPISFSKPVIGLAKYVSAAPKLVPATGNTFEFTYTLVVVNFGPVDLVDVRVTDDLIETFGLPSPPAFDWSVVSVSSPSVANPIGCPSPAPIDFSSFLVGDFDGGYDGAGAGPVAGPDTVIVTGAGLLVGECSTLDVVVRLTTSSTQIFFNQAYAFGTNPDTGEEDEDASDNSQEVDEDGDGDPDTDKDPTPVQIENPTLAVELVVFRAEPEGQNILLTWETASERDHAGFAIESKRDGRTFEEVAFVKGTGSPATGANYAYTVERAEFGRHTFRLRQVDLDGKSTYSPEVEVVVELAGKYVLEPAYPNPFNPTTTIRFAVKESAPVRVELFNALGRRLDVLYEGTPEAASTQSVRIDAGALTSGLYFVRMTGDGFTATQKVTLLK